MPFELLKSETVYQGRYFSVRKDQISLPDGKSTWLDIVAHRGSVIMVPVDGDGLVWFVRQYRHPAGKMLLELPAGVAEAGEEAQVNAQREIREEIGMAAGSLQLLGGFYLAPGYSTEWMHVFLATQLIPSPLRPDADEFLSLEKMPVAQALALAESGQLEDAKSIAALLMARPYLIKMGVI
jgi:ADP-ribose pyrophosphatase